MKTAQATEPKYPVGIAVLIGGERARLISRKWSHATGWWYEARDNHNNVRQLREEDVVGTED